MAKAIDIAALKSLSFEQFDEKYPQFIKGKPNIDRLRAMSLLNESLVFDVQTGRADMPRGVRIDDLRRNLIDSAERVYGVDPRHLLDIRTDAEKAADVLKSWTDAPEKIFEDIDEELKAVESAFNQCDLGLDNYLEERVRDVQATADERRHRSAEMDKRLGKAARERIERVRSLIRRVLRLRQRVREDAPAFMLRHEEPRGLEKLRVENGDWPRVRRPEALEAANLGRYMAYVCRSGMAQEGDGPEERILSFGPHHYKMFGDIWQSENSVHIGFPLGSNNLERIQSGVGLFKGVTRCRGGVVIAPPAHSKTEVAQAWTMRRIARNPATQGTYLHNREDMAQTSLAYIASAFKPDNAMGRRNLAIFPDLAIATSNASELRMRRENRKKTPTLVGAGVMSDHQGSDNDFQVYDDAVPQSDVHEESVRERRIAKINGTWRRRLRGQKHFTLVVCTLWHHADYNATLIRQAKEGKARFLVSRQWVGGPRTTPKFHALWDRIPASELEAIYMEMNDPVLWSCTFMADPRPEESRIIRKLRFYDPDADEHRRFMMAGPTFWLSLDPSYSNRKEADRSGLVYAALGLVSREEWSEGIRVVTTEMRLRIMDAIEFHATQAEGADAVKMYALTHKVDSVLVEAQSGGIGSLQWIERETNCRVEGYKPGSKDKELRLRMAAKCLENHSQAKVTGAVVEFPGEVRDGKIVGPAMSVRGLVGQILEFGMTGNDHMLDACTQLVIYLMHELRPGGGEFSERVRESISRQGDPRLKELVKSWLRPREDDRVEQEWNLLN
jgi:hypothetical protein